MGIPLSFHVLGIAYGVGGIELLCNLAMGRPVLECFLY